MVSAKVSVGGASVKLPNCDAEIASRRREIGACDPKQARLGGLVDDSRGWKTTAVIVLRYVFSIRRFQKQIRVERFAGHFDLISLAGFHFEEQHLVLLA